MEVCSTLKAFSFNLIAAKLFKLKRWNTHQSVAEMMGYRLIWKWITPTSNEWKILIFESPLPWKNQKIFSLNIQIQFKNQMSKCYVRWFVIQFEFTFLSLTNRFHREEDNRLRDVKGGQLLTLNPPAVKYLEI